MPETATRLPRIRPDKKPDWADVIDKFYADSFDARTKDALLESAEAFSDMAPEEQAFHQAHLTFRQVQALADIHATLKGIERGLAGLDPKALGALRHLPGVKKALVVIARGQQEMLDLLESGAGSGGVAGDDRDEDDDNDDGAGEEDDDEDSELADAVDADEVEEEDHGNGDSVAVVTEVLPAGVRRPVSEEGGDA
ncbi:MAG: hypothetical protein Q8P41_30000 [Pseudomonadota bacterium]|nr:hypothetical protein [Pseudomonadota bacterium]